MSAEVHSEKLRLAGELVELESNAVYCAAAKIEWLEVSADILKHFCGGKIPDEGYFIYKNVRLCLPDTAEQIAKRDGMTCHEIMFKDEGHMKVR